MFFLFLFTSFTYCTLITSVYHETCVYENSTLLCNNSISGSILYSNPSSPLHIEISSVWDDNSNSIKYIQPPINLIFSTIKAETVIFAHLKNHYYNVYEEYENIEGCPFTKGIGECYNSNTNPPIYNNDNSNNFVLCCLNGKRGRGNHCIRYDYSQRYNVYKPYSINNIQITNVIMNDGNITSFNISNPDYKIQIEGKLQMEIQLNELSLLPPIDLCTIAYNTNSNISNYNNWFYFFPNQQQLNYSANIWKNEVSCNQYNNLQTATHGEKEHIKDQFYVWKRDNRLSYCGIDNNNFYSIINTEQNSISLHSQKDYSKLVLFNIENINIIDN